MNQLTKQQIIEPVNQLNNQRMNEQAKHLQINQGKK